MNSTDSVRSLLGECNANWHEYSSGQETKFYVHNGDDRPYAAIKCSFGTNNVFLEYNCTPEQAVGAVLNRNECHDLGECYDMFYCDSCDCSLRLFDCDSEPTLMDDFIATTPKYCPICGRKVVEDGSDE